MKKSVIREENENELANSEEFTITISLNEEAPAEIMGKELKFNIHLVANQLQAPTASDASETTAP